MPTILHRLAKWAESDPNSVAQRYWVSNQWKEITAKEFCDRVYWLALYLKSKGMGTQDIGTHYSYNCPQWVHAELAMLLIGARSAGIYPNSNPKDLAYILEHTESQYLSIQNKSHFLKLPKKLKFILVFEGDSNFSPNAVSYADAIKRGKKLATQRGAPSLRSLLESLNPQAPAFLIYTSGTTGRPKGAMLSHDNLIYTIDVGMKHWGLIPNEGQGRLFSFLPLCHIAEKLQNLGGGIGLRYSVSFCSKFENVSRELPQVEPTLLLCVPRLWEKMMEGAEKKIEESFFVKRLLARWALKVGAETAEARFSGEFLPMKDWYRWKIANALVLSRMRSVLGLGKARTLAAGAAALPSHVFHWFRSVGLEILQDYGQTESTGVICMAEKGVDSSGSVGKAVAGLEVKLAEDGEILTRGRHVFLGYLKDEEATAQVLRDGWLHTGDLARQDEQGVYRIQGRKKEVLKTSGGKMVAPLPIEEALKAAPLISQVCMVGDGRKYLSALITLSENRLSEMKEMLQASAETVITSPEVTREVQKYIDQLNASLASYEQIKKFAVLSREFSVQEGEMTPTLKIKRNVIESRYKDVIEQFYVSA